MSHLLLLLLFAALVSTVFAAIQRHGVRAQIRYGARLFGAFVLSALVTGWLMAPFPG